MIAEKITRDQAIVKIKSFATKQAIEESLKDSSVDNIEKISLGFLLKELYR